MRVYQQISTTGLHGTWTNAHAVNDINTEGPASFWDNAVDTEAHLLLDYFSTNSGYKPLSTGSWQGGVEGGVWTDETNTTPPGLRHGSVLSLTQTQWNALQVAY